MNRNQKNEDFKLAVAIEKREPGYQMTVFEIDVDSGLATAIQIDETDDEDKEAVSDFIEFVLSGYPNCNAIMEVSGLSPSGSRKIGNHYITELDELTLQETLLARLEL